MSLELDRRRALLAAALGFLQLEPRAPELRLLHHWLDSWTGVGLIVVGVERQGLRFSLSHIAEGEWRAQFSVHPMWASAGYGVATTQWQAVQRAGGGGAGNGRRIEGPEINSTATFAPSKREQRTPPFF